MGGRGVAAVRALQSVRTAAPDAEIAILGHPWIVPAGIQATLDDVVRRAAEETGVTYIDLSEVSDGHDATRTRWGSPRWRRRRWRCWVRAEPRCRGQDPARSSRSRWGTTV
jgi:hypothetical protein